jgi:two-component system, OmpR family, phosphate regulon sensor histidine kinase PhoR
VLSTTRRITLYWLLLLLPTLAVGTGALALLRREQARLDEQAAVLADSRLQTTEARVRLIVENVELLIDDLKSALMLGLQEAPVINPASFLEAWEQNHALVRTAFHLDEAGTLQRPAASNETAWVTHWWESTIRDGTPQPKMKAPVVAASEARRRNISANVAQVQSARSAIQDAVSPTVRPEPVAEAASPPAPSGQWMPWVEKDQLHLIGWRRLPSGDTLGVEVDLAAFAERLRALLPEEELPDEFVIRGTGGLEVRKLQHFLATNSRTGRSERRVIVPLSASVLPGWEVVGYINRMDTPNGAGGGFFLIGTLLVGTFVAAILSGGSLLLWQARRSEQEAALKTSFVANVSHEFKTPLTTIRLYSELLEQGRVRDEEQERSYLQTIGRETQRLARLVNNALDFSRLEQGRRSFVHQPVDLAEMLNRLLDTHTPRLCESGLSLHRTWPDHPLEIPTDRDAVEQIVLNLLDNACKYGHQGGEITVELTRGTRGACIRVADRGPGVPAAHRARIFEKFHRVDDALTSEKSGAGLGLSIARQLAHGLGGTLRYEHRPGGGATFVLELP